MYKMCTKVCKTGIIGEKLVKMYKMYKKLYKHEKLSTIWTNSPIKPFYGSHMKSYEFIFCHMRLNPIIVIIVC